MHLDTASAARRLPFKPNTWGAAQVAEQQGKYLAKQLNTSAKAQREGKPPPDWPPFQYHHLGSMALVGATLPMHAVSFIPRYPSPNPMEDPAIICSVCTSSHCRPMGAAATIRCT